MRSARIPRDLRECDEKGLYGHISQLGSWQIRRKGQEGETTRAEQSRVVNADKDDAASVGAEWQRCIQALKGNTKASNRERRAEREREREEGAEAGTWNLLLFRLPTWKAISEIYFPFIALFILYLFSVAHSTYQTTCACVCMCVCVAAYAIRAEKSASACWAAAICLFVLGPEQFSAKAEQLLGRSQWTRTTIESNNEIS